MQLELSNPSRAEATIDQRSILRRADAYRRMAFSFIRDGARWQRRELVEWLAQHHALAEWSFRESEPPSSSRRRTPVSHDHLRDWVAEALCQVYVQLDRLAVPEEAHRFGLEAVQAGLVTPTCDDLGRCGFAPVGLRRMSLADRVLSLVAADYLMRPVEYAERLRRCGGCAQHMFVDRMLVGKAAPRCKRCAKAPTLRWRNAVMGARPANEEQSAPPNARRTA